MALDACNRTLAVTTAMPAGTVTQMPDASRLMSGLAACRRCVRARAGSTPGRASGPRGSVLAGPGSGRLVAWGTDSCIVCKSELAQAQLQPQYTYAGDLQLHSTGTAMFQQSQEKTCRRTSLLSFVRLQSLSRIRVFKWSKCRV